MIKERIGTKILKLKIGTGYSSKIALSPDILQKFKKRHKGHYAMKNFKGDINAYYKYQLDSLSLGFLKINKPMVIERNDIISPFNGILGYKFLEENSLCFDLSAKKITRISDKKPFINHPNCIQIPYKKEPLGPVVTIKTNQGDLRFFIDTTSLKTQLNTDLPNAKNEELLLFLPNGTVVLSPDFQTIKAGSEWVDGALGLDFLQKFQLLIDSESSSIYLKKSS